MLESASAEGRNFKTRFKRRKVERLSGKLYVESGNRTLLACRYQIGRPSLASKTTVFSMSNNEAQ